MYTNIHLYIHIHTHKVKQAWQHTSQSHTVFWHSPFFRASSLGVLSPKPLLVVYSLLSRGSSCGILPPSWTLPPRSAQPPHLLPPPRKVGHLLILSQSRLRSRLRLRRREITSTSFQSPTRYTNTALLAPRTPSSRDSARALRTNPDTWTASSSKLRDSWTKWNRSQPWGPRSRSRSRRRRRCRSLCWRCGKGLEALCERET